MTKLILPFPPSANRYWRHDRGHIHRSDEANAYINAVGWLCKERELAPVSGDVVLTIDIYRPAKRGDLDNTLKVLIDALRGFAYVDDKQVAEIHAKRHEDKENPRAVVRVTNAVG